MSCYFFLWSHDLYICMFGVAGYDRWSSMAFDAARYPPKTKRNSCIRLAFAFAKYTIDMMRLGSKWPRWWSICCIGTVLIWWCNPSVPTNVANGTTKCGIVGFGNADRRICAKVNATLLVATNPSSKIDWYTIFECVSRVVVNDDLFSFIDQVNTISSSRSSL